ncbi:MAG: CpsD/CapB family tyrosine-protein kinase [Gammaproteobacteria bacterium]|nr:CpsD/CapB family tyrosine-protein kinase [Gammaproteobacteria bacterium]NNF62548.1 CpsD/CapB family tyrosine-protein kinase [Gammaproteobacteria bacterium]NNM20749.1 CpsD/CapB family tyrosine-protein kinase [Gammaproteobacteria bacterium]
MERIKEALERARQQREASAGSVAAAPARQPSPRRVQARAPDSLEIEYTQTRIISPDPVVMREKRVVSSSRGDAVADAYRMLRTRVIRAMKEQGWNSLAITSPRTGEGKSLTAVNLALSMAREVDRTVLLVDLDMRRPSTHEFFGFEVEQGLSDYLSGDVELADLLVNPAVERFVVLPGRGRVENSSELLGSPKMEQLSQEIAARYPERIVIYDLPPVLAVDDALAFSPQVDAFLLVVEEGETQAEEILAAHDVLAQANILGTVLNKSTESQSNYYYY